jgi:hypothetical protein
MRLIVGLHIHFLLHERTMQDLTSEQNTSGMTTFVLRMPPSLRSRLRAVSLATGVSQQALVRASIATYLETYRIQQETAP